jgi:6-phosphogluconolactonase
MSRPTLDNHTPHYPTWILCMACLLFTLPARSEPEQSSSPAKAPRKIIELVAGSYTSGDSRGVYRFAYNTQTQSFSRPTLLTQMNNPSFGALSSDATRMYFVEEGPEGQVRSFRQNFENASITEINTLSSQGENPCYLSLSPNGSTLRWPIIAAVTLRYSS